MEFIKCERLVKGLLGILALSDLFIAAVHYTHIDTCYVLLLLLLSTTHISTHAMYCCYCCCPLHTYRHMLCIVAIAAVHYTHIDTCYVLLLLWTSHIHLVVYYKIIGTYHNSLLLSTAPICSLQSPSRSW